MNKKDRIQAIKASLMDIFVYDFKCGLVKHRMSINYYANDDAMKFFDLSYGAENAKEYEQAVDEFIFWMSIIYPLVSFCKRILQKSCFYSAKGKEMKQSF